MKGIPQKLIIFVKAPREGLVKTRLAASIGAPAAALAYRTLMKRLIDRLREIPAVELRYAPDDALSEIQPWLQSAWTARPQGDGDLGSRLDRAFAEAFAEHADKVVVIGSDCPTVTARDIRQAWTGLSKHDLVLGPATDGGYWLIGLRKHAPRLFESIPWSTDTVFRETLKRAKETRLSLHHLRERKDIDTAQDWLAFAKAHGIPHAFAVNASDDSPLR